VEKQLMRKVLPMNSLPKRLVKPDGKAVKPPMVVEEAVHLQAVAIHPSSMARQVTETNRIIKGTCPEILSEIP
jgi:hypothetical protein